MAHHGLFAMIVEQEPQGSDFREAPNESSYPRPSPISGLQIIRSHSNQISLILFNRNWKLNKCETMQLLSVPVVVLLINVKLCVPLLLSGPLVDC